MHIAESACEVLVVRFYFGRKVITVPNWLFLVWYCLHPLRSQVIEKQLKLILVFRIVFMYGKRKADRFKFRIKAHFFTCDVGIKCIFALKCLKSEISQSTGHIVVLRIAHKFFCILLSKLLSIDGQIFSNFGADSFKLIFANEAILVDVENSTCVAEIAKT